MKITSIQIDNLLGARRIDVSLTTPVTVFAGHNGVGKSSIAESIKLAITGEQTRVDLKKEYPLLVTDGSKAGGALIGTGKGSYQAIMPDGKFTADDGLPTGAGIAVALDGQRFAHMTENERRTFILAVTGTRASAEVIQKRLTDRNLAASKIETVLPLLRSGFAAGEEFAKDEAKKAKGAWKQIANATWGSKAAATWHAEKPAPVDTQYRDADLTEIQRHIDECNQQIGELRAKQQTHAANTGKRSALQQDADMLERRKEHLARVESELVEHQAKVEEARQRASGKREGLVHDMAAAISGIISITEDSQGIAGYHLSGHVAQWSEFEEYDHAAKVLSKYIAEYGNVPEGEADLEVIAALPALEKSLAVLQNSVTNLRRDIARSEAAAEELKTLPAEEDADYAEQINQANNRKSELTVSMQAIRDELQHVESVVNQILSADKRTEDARRINDSIGEWLAIADALAPTGIPSELLAEALAPINAQLTSAAAYTSWMPVYIDADMQITAATRPYRLLSESEQWRVDAMIAYAVSQVSGLKIMMMDRMDVLDLPSRGVFLGWMDELAAEGKLDTALVFATLKQPISVLPATIGQHWITGGTIEKMREAA